MFPKMVSTKGLTKSVGEACPPKSTPIC